MNVALVALDSKRAFAKLSFALTDSSFVQDSGLNAAIYIPGGANLYKASFQLPQQGFGISKSLLYQFRPRFNYDSTNPPSDDLSETSNSGYLSNPIVVLYNATTGQSMFIGSDASARYSADSNGTPYTVAYGLLGVQGSQPFYATPNDYLSIYTYQNPGLVNRKVGFLNLQFANFDIPPFYNTQGGWLTAVNN